MNPSNRHYIQNIVLSYLQSCLVDPHSRNMQIDKHNARHRARILKSIFHDNDEKQIQALYGIQKFIIQLKHPRGMARDLFDIFYDEDCVKEELFWNWLRRPNPEERNGQTEIIESTKDFFNWLSQPTPSNIQEDIDNEDDD